MRCETEDMLCVDYRVTAVYNNKARLRYKEEYRFKGCSNVTVSVSMVTVSVTELGVRVVMLR